MTRKSVVTGQQAMVFYQSHKAQYVRPQAVWLQTITITVPSDATARAEAGGAQGCRADPAESQRGEKLRRFWFAGAEALAGRLGG